MPPEPLPRTRTDQFLLDCFGMNARNLLGLSTTIQCRTSSVTPAAFSVRNEHAQRRAPARDQCRISLMNIVPTLFPRRRQHAAYAHLPRVGFSVARPYHECAEVEIRGRSARAALRRAVVLLGDQQAVPA